MNAHESERRLGVKEQRLERITSFVPYVALAVSTILALLIGPPDGHGLTATVWPMLTLMWMLGWRALPPAWTGRQTLKSAYFIGLLAFTAVLVGQSGLYGFFAWCNYLLIQEFLPVRWQIAGLIVAAFLHVSTFFGGPQEALRLTGADAAALLIIVAVVSALVFLLGRMAEVSTERSENRRRMVAELAEANRRLEALIKENEGLHAQLLTQAREAGVLDERQRMAREIHDTLAQGLTGIVTQVQAARNAADRPEDWRQHLDSAARLARDSLSEARRSVQAMAPEALETAHLPDALADVAKQWSGTNGVAIEVTTTGTARPLHPEVEVTLLRTTQEALANVAKHAEASRVGVTLSYMEDVVTLDVLDDGVGFDPDRVRPGGTGGDPRTGGFGLRAMRQRVDRLAGQLTIESEAGGGTVVSASVPAIPPETAARAAGAEAREMTHG